MTLVTLKKLFLVALSLAVLGLHLFLNKLSYLT